jgi:hypothetical protein
MRWIAVWGLFAALLTVPSAFAHDRNLSGLRIRRGVDSVLLTVDTHRSALGESDVKAAIGRRLRLRLDGRRYVPVAPDVGAGPEADGVVWRDRVPYPVSSIVVEGTLYPENPQSRLAVVVADRDVALQGAMLGPDLGSWTYGVVRRDASEWRALLGESLREWWVRWAQRRASWVALVALGLFAGAGFGGAFRGRLPWLVSGILAGGVLHFVSGIGLTEAAVEGACGLVAVFACVSGLVQRPAAGPRAFPVLLLLAGGILGGGAASPTGERWLALLRDGTSVAASVLTAVVAVWGSGWLASKTVFSGPSSQPALRRSAAGLLLALAAAFSLMSQIPPSR